MLLRIDGPFFCPRCGGTYEPADFGGACGPPPQGHIVLVIGQHVLLPGDGSFITPFEWNEDDS